MRVFVAGATGAIGRRLVPLLVGAGHDVTGTGRTDDGMARLGEQGAAGVRVDVFDRDEMHAAVMAAEPDVVVHQLTALSDGNAVDNARIRGDGTRNLVDAAKLAGVRRIVAQSIAFAYEPGEEPAAENTPLDLAAGEPRSVSVQGVVALESTVAEIDTHVVLRFGTFYGPGTWHSRTGLVAQKMRKGEYTANDGVTSFIHVDDAAAATVRALSWPSGAVNIVDDEPAPARVWAPVFAEAVGVPRPPATDGSASWERGASNTLARTDRGWSPSIPSWRTGFAVLS